MWNIFGSGYFGISTFVINHLHTLFSKLRNQSTFIRRKQTKCKNSFISGIVPQSQIDNTNTIIGCWAQQQISTREKNIDSIFIYFLEIVQRTVIWFIMCIVYSQCARIQLSSFIQNLKLIGQEFHTRTPEEYTQEILTFTDPWSQ